MSKKESKIIKPEDENESSSQEKKDKPELLTEASHDLLIQQLNEAEQKANQYWERILRMQADNENLLRRTERDIANAHKYALERFINELLPIVDSLELCVSNSRDKLDGVASSIIEGINLTLKMFYTAFEKFGIKQINPVSQPFDSEFQQAISMQVSKEVKPGTVINVLQKGYTLNNRLVRPALVIVSKSEE